MKNQIYTLLFLLSMVLPIQASSPHFSAIQPPRTEKFTISEFHTARIHKEEASLGQRIEELLDDDLFEHSQVGIYVYDLTADSLIFAHHEKQTMRPASTEKLITAITALHTLGTDYTYKTKLYLETEEVTSDFNGAIYVEGGYDPLFDEEDMRAFAQALKAKGILNIKTPIYFDGSFKDDKKLGWGWCWDDKEVPLTPLLYKNKDHFAERLQEALGRVGITWNGNFEWRRVSKNAQLILTRTHHIDQILLPLMKDSNNSMAESLFYQIAAQNGNKPGTRRKALTHIHSIIRKIGLNPANYQIADGSGLSLYNYITPELLGRMLRFAYENNGIYTHLLPSLPIAAEDGTLEKRMHNTKAADNVQAKTGTVEGVSTLAGFCTAANGNRLCFSIMNQGVLRGKMGRDFQDKVCDALCR